MANESILQASPLPAELPAPEDMEHAAPKRDLPTLLRHFIMDYLLLLGAFAVAAYVLRQVPLRVHGSGSEWRHPQFFAALLVGLLIAHGLAHLGSRLGPLRSAHRWAAFLSVLAGAVTLSLWAPGEPLTETVYFIISGLLLVLLVVPGKPLSAEQIPLREALARLWESRALLRIWVLYNVRSRYAQAILGILWIILLPLSTALVLSLVFSQFMRFHIQSTPFIAYFLAGFVPWLLFSQAISGAMRSLLGSMGLMNQIYFPREVLVLTALGEAVVDTFFMFVAMLVINFGVGVHPTALYLLLPLLFAVELVFSLGLMFIVGYQSVMIRDVPQLVSVLLQLLFYMSPIIYPVSIVPERYRFLITLNPIAPLVDAFHRVIIYNRTPDWLGVIYVGVMAIGFLAFGYRHFKAREDQFADMI